MRGLEMIDPNNHILDYCACIVDYVFKGVNPSLNNEVSLMSRRVDLNSPGTRSRDFGAGEISTLQLSSIQYGVRKIGAAKGSRRPHLPE
jgi:hypothetical protein